MEVDIIKRFPCGQDVTDAWRSFQESTQRLESPYFRPEFTEAVASVRDDVELAVVREGGVIKAIFPYQRGKSGVGSPVGGIFSDYQGLICADEYVCDIPKLIRSCGLRIWDFDHLLASQAMFSPFHRLVEISPQIDLSAGYGAYVEERHRSGSLQISKCANMMRRLEREIGPLSFVPDCRDPFLLGQVLEWKSSQYRSTGKRDLFELEWTRPLLQAIHRMNEARFSGMLSLLYAGDRLIAGHFGMRSRSVWHYWFPAYDEKMGKYSPGLILLLKMAENAPKNGLGVIDLGKGISLYKERLMNASVRLASGSVELPSIESFKRRLHRNIRVAAKKIAENGVFKRANNNLFEKK